MRIFPHSLHVPLEMAHDEIRKIIAWSQDSGVTDRRLSMRATSVICSAVLFTSLFLVAVGCGGSGDAGKHFDAAAELEEKGRLEEAIAEYDEAVRISPQYVVAYSNRATIYHELGQYQQAVESYNQAIAVNPNFNVLYNNRASSYYSLGEYELAVLDLNRFIDFEPNNPEGYVARATVYDQLGREAEARNDAVQAVELGADPARFETLIEEIKSRAVELEAQEQLVEAIAEYDEAIRINPRDVLAYSNRGDLRNKLGQYQQAVESYNLAIGVDPNSNSLYNNRSSSYYSLGEYERSLEDLNRFIEHEPNNADSYVGRAMVYTQLGRDEEAEIDVTQALELGVDPAEVEIRIEEIKGQR